VVIGVDVCWRNAVGPPPTNHRRFDLCNWIGCGKAERAPEKILIGAQPIAGLHRLDSALAQLVIIIGRFVECIRVDDPFVLEYKHKSRLSLVDDHVRIGDAGYHDAGGDLKARSREQLR
jgi:hypothetical protein